MRYKSIIILVLTAVLVHIATAQEYPGIEKTAQFNLLGSVNIEGWAYGIIGFEDYLYVNVTLEGLATYDVSNPIDPYLTDLIMGSNEQAMKLSVGNGYLYAPYGPHIYAYDIQNPAQPEVTNGDYGDILCGSVFLDDNFVITSKLNGIAPFEIPLVRLFDAEDPTNPDMIWELTSPYNAVFSAYDFQRSILYFGSLVMVDFSNPYSPTTVFYEDYGIPLCVDNNYLWCYSDYSIIAYDISNPFNLSYEGIAINVEYSPVFIDIVDDVAIIAYNNGPVILYDIQNRFELVPEDSIIMESDVSSMYINQDLLYLTNSDSLFIFSIESGGGINESEIELSPIKNALIDCYPNPFNASTTIRFDLPETGVVRLIIYDIQGREAAKLIDGYKSAGHHEVIFDGTDLASGIYFARLTAGNYQQTKKMVLMK